MRPTGDRRLSASTPTFRQQVVRYGGTVLATVAAFVLRQGLTRLLGDAFPPYITFFPTVMLAALLAGFGPGLLATGLATGLAAYWVLPPHGQWSIATPADAVGLAVFTCMGLGLSVFAKLYHAARHRAAAVELDLAVQTAQARAAAETERQRQLLSVTLASIGDAVIVTDTQGRITFLNGEAERLTGWHGSAAVGQPLATVFRILNEQTRQPVTDPAQEVFRRGTVVGLANHTVLIAQDGREIPIDDSAAPVRQADGTLHGVVLVFRDVTERRRAVEALHRYELLAAHSRDIILFMRSEDGRLLEVNAAAASAYGYTHEELLALTIHNLRAPGTEPLTSAQMTQADTQGLLFETVHRRKDGSTFPVEVSSRGATIGGIRTLVSVVRDISERKRAEAALLESEERFRAVVETAPEAIFIQTRGCFAYLNPAAVGFFGAAGAEQLLGQPVADRIHPARRAAVLERLRHLDDIQQPVPLTEETILRCDGGATDVEGWTVPFTYQGTQGALVFVRDVTARKAMEVALQRQTNRLEAVRAVSTEITRELNRQTVLDLIVRRAVELTRAGAGMVHLWDARGERLAPQSTLGVSSVRLAVTLAPGEGVAGAVAATRRGLVVNDFRGSAYATPAIVAVSPHNRILGEPLEFRDRCIGVITVSRDAGEPGFADDEQDTLRLLAIHAAIAIENARLFAELQASYDALQQAQAELVRSEKLRVVGQLSAGIAHDLNNTLAAVLGQVEVLQLGVTDPTLQHGLHAVETAVLDGAQVVRRLQDFARQQPAEQRGALEIAPLVADVVAITRPRWKDDADRQGTSIQVITRLANLPRILGDAAELREALLNLVLNAVDAMPAGGTLTIAGQAVPGAPAWVDVTVSDTGIGMSEEVRQRAIDPFFTTKGVQGTGLGLSVVYATVIRYGGRMDIASAPGQGTTVTLRLPAAPAEARPTARLPAWGPVSPRRVLVVDDDATVRSPLASLLRAAGHTVLEADGGSAALALLGTQSVDCLVTDLGMPDMTGWALARDAKRLMPTLPVLLLTGWGSHVGAEEPDADRLADRLLGKPVRIEDLLAAIAELTEGR